MRILDRNKINQVSVDTEFFPFFHIENVFSSNTEASSLTEDFPEIDRGGSFPTEKLSDGILKDLIQELEGNEFKSLLEEKFNIDLANSEVVTTLRGYSRAKDGQIHTDSTSKILTVLLYLNIDWKNNEGNLRLLKENNNLENTIKEISSEFGNLIAFKVTENCWHGFRAFEGKRLSIQLNYIHPNSLSSHNLRHRISSIFKNLLKR